MAALALILLVAVACAHWLLLPLVHLGVWILEAGWISGLLVLFGLWLVAGASANSKGG